MVFQSTRHSRRHRNPQGQEENKKPFFSKSADTAVQTKEDKAFFQPKLTVGRPGDQYEKEADSMAETVVNHSGSPAVVQEKAEGIQKMDTSKMEEDRMIQEKSLQMQAEEEEEPVQMQAQEEEEPLQMQEEEEEEVQMKAEPGSQTTANAGLSGRIEGSSGKGKPMAEKTRMEMEQAFGVNFTGVNIHTGANAVQMNRELGAQAFTHGKDVYFNAGKYRPESADGKRLLAHELTHVVQQGGGKKNSGNGIKANTKLTENNKKEISPKKNESKAGEYPRAHGGGDNPLDEKALKIISFAQNKWLPKRFRAITVVKKIINAYFPEKKDYVKDIQYLPDIPGLKTTRVGEGPGATGIISVGDYFLDSTNSDFFARRVLQVEHELQHIEQYKTGMTGPDFKDEREFLAFYENAMAVEYQGTGRMPLRLRWGIINTALGYWLCLSDVKKEEYRGHVKSLFFAQDILFDVAKSRKIDILSAGLPPKECKRQN